MVGRLGSGAELFVHSRYRSPLARGPSRYRAVHHSPAGGLPRSGPVLLSPRDPSSLPPSCSHSAVRFPFLVFLDPSAFSTTLRGCRSIPRYPASLLSSWVSEGGQATPGGIVRECRSSAGYGGGWGTTTTPASKPGSRSHGPTSHGRKQATT